MIMLPSSRKYGEGVNKKQKWSKRTDMKKYPNVIIMDGVKFCSHYAIFLEQSQKMTHTMLCRKFDKYKIVLVLPLHTEVPKIILKQQCSDNKNTTF